VRSRRRTLPGIPRFVGSYRLGRLSTDPQRPDAAVVNIDVRVRRWALRLWMVWKLVACLLRPTTREEPDAR
jgi:hypothetical protein